MVRRVEGGRGWRKAVKVEVLEVGEDQNN